jgi:hypothetical protein
VPTWLLNAALRAVVPDLISIGKNADRMGEGPRLYAARPIPTEHLEPVVRSWAHLAFNLVPQARRDTVLAAIHSTDLAWCQLPLDLAAGCRAPVGAPSQSTTPRTCSASCPPRSRPHCPSRS